MNMQNQTKISDLTLAQLRELIRDELFKLYAPPKPLYDIRRFQKNYR
jgi:hypothetical protein